MLPSIMELYWESVPGESKFMKLQKPIVLRFNKFKQTTDSHEFIFLNLSYFHLFEIILNFSQTTLTDVRESIGVMKIGFIM